MKVRLAIADIYQLAARQPNAWHELITAGQVDATGHLIIEQQRELEILAAYQELALPEFPLLEDLPSAPPNPAPAPATRQTETVATIESICGKCEWNVDWVCEHPGCQPCRQRPAGGLKAMIASAGARCPAAKW